MDNNLYKLLNVDPSSDQKTIKKSFSKLIKTTHPDKVSSQNNNEENENIQKAMDLILAYKVLADPETRKDYDLGLLNVSGKNNSWKENRFCLNM